MTYRPHLRLHGVGAISYNSQSHLMFLQGKVNSARYIAQEGDLLPHQDNAYPHMAAAAQHAPCDVQ